MQQQLLITLLFAIATSVHGQDECQCTSWGDPHYRSFDGVRFDYMGKCKYILSETVGNGDCAFSVRAWNGDRGIGAVSFTDAVEIVFMDHSFVMKRGMVLLVDGKEIRSKAVTEGDKVQIRVCGNWLVFHSQACGIRAEWDGISTFNLKLRKSVHGNKVRGLCGNCNGNTADDFLTITGAKAATVVDFAQTFVVNDEGTNRAECKVEKAPPVIQHPCQGDWANRVRDLKYCGGFISTALNPFQKCIDHGRVNIDALYQSCRYDVCMNMNNLAKVSQIVCEALTYLATACSEQGFNDIDWRVNCGCEQKCGPNQIYERKIPPCPVSCDSARQGATCAKDLPFREGCTCQPGFVLYGCECVQKPKCPVNKEVTLTFSRTKSSKKEQTESLDKGFKESFSEESTFTDSGIPKSVKKSGDKSGHHKESKTNKEENFDKTDVNWNGSGDMFGNAADFMKSFQ